MLQPEQSGIISPIKYYYGYESLNGEHNFFIEYDMTSVSNYATTLLCRTLKDADYPPMMGGNTRKTYTRIVEYTRKMFLNYKLFF